MKSLCLTVAVLVTAASAAGAQELDGQALFAKNCQKCHGATGTPSAAMAKMHATLKPWTAEIIGAKSEEQIVTLLTNGSENGKKKPMKDKLTPEEMAAVAKYVKATFGGEK